MLSGLRSNLQVGFDLCPPLWLRPPLVAPQSSSPQGYARRLLALAVHSLPAYLGRVYLGFKSLPPAACGSNSNLQVGFGGTWWLPLATYDQCACDPAGSIAQSFKCCGSGAGNCGSYYETLEGEGIEGRPVGSMDQAGSYISWIFDVHLRLWDSSPCWIHLGFQMADAERPMQRAPLGRWDTVGFGSRKVDETGKPSPENTDPARVIDSNSM